MLTDGTRRTRIQSLLEVAMERNSFCNLYFGRGHDDVEVDITLLDHLHVQILRNSISAEDPLGFGVKSQGPEPENRTFPRH